MTLQKTKYLTILILLLAVSIWSFLIFVNSLSSDKIWKIILASIGFTGFLVLFFLFVREKYKSNRKPN